MMGYRCRTRSDIDLCFSRKVRVCTDLLFIVGNFGTRRRDAGYDARYDLDSDGAIGFSDFPIFANSFGTGSG